MTIRNELDTLRTFAKRASRASIEFLITVRWTS
jgi:hypothetical protein